MHHEKFLTDKLHDTIIDAPGRKDLIKYMIDGASQTNVDLIMAPADGIEDFIKYMINGASQTDVAPIVLHQSGVTIACTAKELSTDKLRYTIIDTPGHKDFIEYMISGAYQTDVALIRVPVGESEKARRSTQARDPF